MAKEAGFGSWVGHTTEIQCMDNERSHFMISKGYDITSKASEKAMEERILSLQTSAYRTEETPQYSLKWNTQKLHRCLGTTRGLR